MLMLNSFDIVELQKVRAVIKLELDQGYDPTREEEADYIIWLDTTMGRLHDLDELIASIERQS